MTTAAMTDREVFNGASAQDIARSIDPALVPTQSPSARFTCFADQERLLVVAGGQEGRQVELALAYGLSWAAGRQLLLALPRGMSSATAQRIPWLSSDVRPEVWGHNEQAAHRLAPSTQEQTVDAVRASLGDQSPEAEFRRASTAHHLGDRAAWVTDLVDAVTHDERLDPAHRQGERSWHHRGQRACRSPGRAVACACRPASTIPTSSGLPACGS